jgi:hypothetical protein
LFIASSFGDGFQSVRIFLICSVLSANSDEPIMLFLYLLSYKFITNILTKRNRLKVTSTILVLETKILRFTVCLSLFIVLTLLTFFFFVHHRISTLLQDFEPALTVVLQDIYDNTLLVSNYQDLNADVCCPVCLAKQAWGKKASGPAAINSVELLSSLLTQAP